jgi:hypothetical protein
MLKEFAATILAPEGFTRTEHPGWLRLDGGDSKDPNYFTVELASPDIRLFFRITARDHYEEGVNLGPAIAYSGTTAFKKGSQWYSFDRRGIDDSFSWSPYSREPADPNRTTAEQIKRVHDHLKADKLKVTIPHYGHRITPQEKEEFSKRLLAGKSITLTPAGFGIGHTITVKRPRGRFGIFAVPAEVATFFGVPHLFDQHFDHD